MAVIVSPSPSTSLALIGIIKASSSGVAWLSMSDNTGASLTAFIVMETVASSELPIPSSAT